MTSDIDCVELGSALVRSLGVCCDMSGLVIVGGR